MEFQHTTGTMLYETPLLVDVEEACAGGCSLLCATSGTAAEVQEA